MKVVEKVSWLTGRVQENLFPHLNQCLKTPLQQSAEEAIKELPVLCDRGAKKNAKGYKTSWNGYKLHPDTNDNQRKNAYFARGS
jgi:hypothetical protein